jgi:hypothetical protein
MRRITFVALKNCERKPRTQMRDNFRPIGPFNQWLGVTTVNFPSTPDLLLQALTPGVVALALGACVLATRRAQALAATFVSVGLALTTLSLLVASTFTFAALGEVAESPLLLLGVPLGVLALALVLLLRRAQSSILASVACAMVGLAGLYWLGGFVLMYSACSFHLGGC